jgi:hypothetical protein
MKSNSKTIQDASIDQQCLYEPVRFRETEWRTVCYGVVAAGLWFQMKVFAYRYYDDILLRREIDVSNQYYADAIFYSIDSILFLSINLCQRSHKVTNLCRHDSVYVGVFLAGFFVQCAIDYFLGEPFQKNNLFWVLSIITSLTACYFLAARSCCWCEGEEECGSSFSIENDDQVLEIKDYDEDMEYCLLIV